MDAEKQKFINDILIPYHIGLNSNKSPFIIYDAQGKIIIASEIFLEMLGYSSLDEITGKTFSEVYKFDNLNAQISTQLEIMRETILNKKISTDFLCASKFKNGLEVFIIQNSPIFYLDGEIIATISIFNKPDEHLCSHEEGVITHRQEEVVFLLAVGGSQKETASILNTTRGTVAKTMESIGIRLNDFPGCSKRTTIDKAARLGYGKLPLNSLKAGVVELSKLYNNNNILSLFNHF